MTKARITYRFDGHNRGTRERPQPQEPKVIPLYEEEFRVVEEKLERNEVEPAEERYGRRRETPVLNDFTTDFGPYRSPFEEETERVERIIRETQHVNGETGYVEGHGGGNGGRDQAGQGGPALHDAGHSEQYREPFATGYEGYRPDPQGPAQDWGEPQIGTRYVRSSVNPPWTRIVLSVAGAVVTGVVFGFLVLSMFTDGGLPFQPNGGGQQKTPVANATGKGAIAAADGAAVTKGDAGAADKTASSSANTASLVAVNLPARSYSFLQNGIFSTPAAAQAQEAELKKKGYASVSESTDKTTVYAGFAMQKEDAVQLGNKLKADKFDVFVKQVDVPAAPKLKWSGKAGASELSAYFQQGDKLLQMIGALTVLHLGETKHSALEQSTLDTVKSTHQAWIAASTAVKSGAPDDVAPALQQMATGLNTAVVSMDEYRKNPSSSLLWQTQSALMQYVLAEKGLLAKLSAQ